MTLAGLVLPPRRLAALLPAALVAGLVGLSVSGLPALAQQAGSPFVGFSQNRDQPINFEADRAEVFDNEKKAILTGNVRIRQGESNLATGRLVILYEDNSGGGRPPQGRPAAIPGASGQPGQQNVRRFEMQGGVMVQSKNQNATAERGSFDARRNEAILEGNVVLTQCDNVLRGSRLQADLTANRVRLDGGPSTAGRVSGVLSSSSGAPGGGGSAANPDCAPTPPARTAPQRAPRG
ncbi:LptA/OstA family protein [Phreatobacter stygius]|uniref:LPS ABC transporter substrate-binding protein LptA n=1 Tax=Phreatobacter stygius TaxID=1940610 RepID=A0A4D7BAA4_9HYPH|nr:LptA/OstA family protein [Phreatobacter stygius]QCI65032.1 LPS ABC transporter substrate-binding protein LptA [Phreatobacter stygius]